MNSVGHYLSHLIPKAILLIYLKLFSSLILTFYKETMNSKKPQTLGVFKKALGRSPETLTSSSRASLC